MKKAIISNISSTCEGYAGYLPPGPVPAKGYLLKQQQRQYKYAT